ncbi:MAG: hypothetical protein KKC54_08590, partial [Nanoarchaeota archaeon]|nr:hypothetical protein [Nanoarchaeota archaeon]
AFEITNQFQGLKKSEAFFVAFEITNQFQGLKKSEAFFVAFQKVLKLRKNSINHVQIQTSMF